MRQENTETQQNELGEIEKIVSLNRVAKGRQGRSPFSASAPLVVVGDGKGGVGFGLGRPRECLKALRKATERARKNRVQVSLLEHARHEVLGRFGAGRVMLKPASEGTGIIAGGAVRAVMEAVGIRDVLAKTPSVPTTRTTCFAPPCLTGSLSIPV